MPAEGRVDETGGDRFGARPRVGDYGLRRTGRAPLGRSRARARAAAGPGPGACAGTAGPRTGSSAGAAFATGAQSCSRTGSRAGTGTSTDPDAYTGATPAGPSRAVGGCGPGGGGDREA